MKFKNLAPLLLISLFTYVTPTLAENETPNGDSAAAKVFARLTANVKRMTLSNGLRVLYYPRKDAPVFAGQLWVKVGGVNEVPGFTGAAHLLEHMAFKGTDKIGTKDHKKEQKLLDEVEQIMDIPEGARSEKQNARLKSIYKELEEISVPNEFSRIYQEQGAVGLNAGTSKDTTSYYVQLPSSAFELWCWMESERLINPVFREFYKERDVVREERRMRTDDSPGGTLYEALLSSAYMIHPYRYPVIGWADDVKSLRTEVTKDIHRTYYVPDNMVLTIVGDLDESTIGDTLERYFGRFPASAVPRPKVELAELPQRGSRDFELYLNAEPSFAMVYHKPVYPNPDDIYFSVLHTLLAGTRNSVLYREFVLKRQLATEIGTDEAPGELFPSLFVLEATPKTGVDSRKLRDEIQQELDRLGKVGFSEKEVAFAKKRVRTQFLSALDSNSAMAGILGRSELLYGDWESTIKMYDLMLAVTNDDLKRLINTYLKKENRTTGFIERAR